MRKALLILAGMLLVASAAQAQQRRTTSPALGDRVTGNPTLEFLIGPQFGSGRLREFDNPITFEQDLDYSGFFFKGGLTLPLRSRVALLFRGSFDYLKSEGPFLFPLIDEFELRRTQSLFSLGFGVRFELR